LSKKIRAGEKYKKKKRGPQIWGEGLVRGLPRLKRLKLEHPSKTTRRGPNEPRDGGPIHWGNKIQRNDSRGHTATKQGLLGQGEGGKKGLLITW